MSKVTSKLQVTVPKVIADRYRIHPGDEIEWVPAGDAIRVVPGGVRRGKLDIAARLRLFDEGTARLELDQSGRSMTKPANRGWTREDLYERGRSR